MLGMQGWSTLISILLSPFNTFVTQHSRHAYKWFCVSIWAACVCFPFGHGCIWKHKQAVIPVHTFKYVLIYVCDSYCADTPAKKQASLTRLWPLFLQYQCIKWWREAKVTIGGFPSIHPSIFYIHIANLNITKPEWKHKINETNINAKGLTSFNFTILLHQSSSVRFNGNPLED